MSMQAKKIRVEIWSDIMCPFCYLGKKKFEKALEQFPDRDRIELSWKSFQLMPSLQTDPSIGLNEFLAREKGFPVEKARQMNAQLTEAGKPYGIDYRFDQAVVANSFRAHRFLHFAGDAGKQNEAEELMFRAYFTEGKNIDDEATLLSIGSELGLDENEVRAVLASERYAEDVEKDIAEANQLGIRGVPCFVIDRQYGISGAQEPEVFLSELKRIAAEL